jgi:hypothetical protein
MAEPENKQEIIDKPQTPDRFDETPRFYNVIGDWWREATGQTSEWHHDLSPGRGILRKIMLWSPAVVVVVLVCGGIGTFFFTGWRAQDLAAKALASGRRAGINIPEEIAWTWLSSNPAFSDGRCQLTSVASPPNRNLKSCSPGLVMIGKVSEPLVTSA